MKEAFWGVLIIVLGLFGIVVVNLFQNVTIDNDRVYYLIKESAEASAYDAIDLTYYRLSGNVRMVEDKFVENLTRRFAQNITVGNYRIVVQDINEIPPKISLGVTSGVTSLRGEKFEIANRLDAVIETKYKLSDVLDFLGITESEWKNYINKADPKGTTGSGDGICKLGAAGDEDKACISGDIVFTGFGGSSGLKRTYCQNETLPNNIPRTANYKQCDCGTWVNKSETVYASPVKSGGEGIYTWRFNKTTDARTISESITERVKVDICTTDIKVEVPRNPDTLKPSGNPNEPSKDNSAYIDCPSGGIRIPTGTIVTLHPRYVPANSTNRSLTWTSSNTGVASLTYSNPALTCALNASNTNCMSKAVLTARTSGITTVTVKTSNNKTGTCKVTVWDGSPDTMKCSDLTVEKGKSKIISSSYGPKNATKTNFTFTSSNAGVATISGNTITGKSAGAVTITMKERNSGKTTTCKATITNPPAPPRPSTPSSGGSRPSSGIIGGWTPSGTTPWGWPNSSSSSSSGFSAWYYTDDSGQKHFTKNEEEAQKGAAKFAGTDKGGEFGVVSDSSSFKKGDFVTTGKWVDSSGNVNYAQNASGNFARAYDSAYAYAIAGSNTGGTWGGTGITGGLPSLQPKEVCFIAGTKIQTENGIKNIEDVEVGEKVLSYNEKTNKTEYKPVLKTFVHADNMEYIYKIKVGNEIIEATGNHPFYANGIYKEAKQLKVGDKLLRNNGNYEGIKEITYYESDELVYNIEVSDNHNYYVEGYLVHNKGTGTGSVSIGSKGINIGSDLQGKEPKGGGTPSIGITGGGCFIAGTEVQTENGIKNIEDVEVGEKVLSYNEKTNKTEYKTVLKTFVHDDNMEYIYKIKVGNEEIEATGNHPFYVDGVYKEAKQLKVGDKLLRSNGNYEEIKEITYYESDELVYNIEVSDNHNYYVEGYLVHNKGGHKGGHQGGKQHSGCFIAGIKVQTIDGYKNIEDIEVGEKVLSYNIATNEQEYRRVTKKLIHNDNVYDLYEVYYDGMVMEATGNHPIYINKKLNSVFNLQYTKKVYNGQFNYDAYKNLDMDIILVRNLKPGNYILGSDGRYHMVTEIRHHGIDGLVYNIEVENNNNYYVGNGILVSSV